MSERERNGSTWEAVRRSLRRWIAGRTSNQSDAEDLLSETITRGLAHLGHRPRLPLPAVVRWCQTTATRLLIDSHRATQRRGTQCPLTLEALAHVAKTPRTSQRARQHVQILANCVTNQTQQRMLALMLKGLTSNSALAAQLSVSVRTIERHKQTLRLRARQRGLRT